MSECCLNLAIKTQKQLQWNQSGVLIFSFEQIPRIFRMPLMLILDIYDALHDLVSFVSLKNLKNTHGGVLLLVKLQTKAWK